MSPEPDRPLDAQTAAPPPAPPRRPIAGAAMADDWDDYAARLHEQARRVAEIRDYCAAILAAHDASPPRVDPPCDSCGL
jgi:hypothetical protein